MTQRPELRPIAYPLTPTCAYPCIFHRGKVEWHHPIAARPEVGLFLCEAHHSLFQGRKKRYMNECQIDKSLAEIRDEIAALQSQVLLKAGLGKGYIDKR